MLKIRKNEVVKIVENNSGIIKYVLVTGYQRIQLHIVDSKNNANIENGYVTKIDEDVCVVTTSGGKEYSFNSISLFNSDSKIYKKGDLSFIKNDMYIIEMEDGEIIHPGITISILDKNKCLICDGFKINEIFVDEETKRCKFIGFQYNDNCTERSLDFGSLLHRKEYTELIPDNENIINTKFKDGADIIRSYNFDFYEYISNLNIEPCLNIVVSSSDNYSEKYVLGSKGDVVSLPINILGSKIMKKFLLLWYDKKNKKVGLIDIQGDKSLYWVDAFEVFGYITKKKIDKIEMVDETVDGEYIFVNKYGDSSINIMDMATDTIINSSKVGEEIVFFSFSDDENNNPYIVSYGELIRFSITQTSVKFILKTVYAGKVIIEWKIRDILKGEIKEIPVLMSRIEK